MLKLAGGRWKPGQAGNPKGKPKRKKLEELVLDLMAKKDPKTGKPPMAVLARHIVDRLLMGDTEMIRLMANRLWPEIKNYSVEASFDLSGSAAELQRRIYRNGVHHVRDLRLIHSEAPENPSGSVDVSEDDPAKSLNKYKKRFKVESALRRPGRVLQYAFTLERRDLLGRHYCPQRLEDSIRSRLAAPLGLGLV
jgi:hypothetical protein